MQINPDQQTVLHAFGTAVESQTIEWADHSAGVRATSEHAATQLVGSSACGRGWRGNGHRSPKCNCQPVTVAGTDFQPLSIRETLDSILEWRRSGHQGTIALSNVHSVMLCRRDAMMSAAIRDADLTLVDGVGVEVAAKLLGGTSIHRVPGPDLLSKLCDIGRSHQLRHFFLGGKPGVADAMAARLQSAYPGLVIAGTYAPPFGSDDATERSRNVEILNAAHADIVWVALGTGRQEKWMMDCRGKVKASALIAVGAAFDFHAGTAERAPMWMQRIGLEWAFRVMKEPKRLWRRDLDIPPFVGVVLIEVLRRRLGLGSAISQQGSCE